MLSAAARSSAEILRTTTPACSRGRLSGARGTTAAATRATAPPISASVQRTKAAPGVGSSAVTKMAWIAAWLTNSTPRSSSSAVVIASATISAICQPPEPTRAVIESPTSTPMATPTETSATRRSRWP